MMTVSDIIKKLMDAGEWETVANIARVMSSSEKGDWIEWNGGEYPTDIGVSIRVRLRSGTESETRNPQNLRWDHIGSRSDVVAYKLT